jgi:hypothetical protein
MRRHLAPISILFACLIATNSSLIAQLRIGPSTNWKSNSSTYVVLDNIGIQYDAPAASLENIFKFTGGIDADLGGTNLPSYYILELAKDGLAKLILQRDITISQSINFQTGFFELNNNQVSLAGTALINNENENSRFIGTNGGNINTIVSLNGPTSVNPGNLGAIITSSQNLGLVTISRGHRSQTNGGGSGNSILRYYDILPANNSNLNATLRFNYFDAELNGLNENSLLLWKSNDNVNWVNAGFTSRNEVDNYVEKIGITDFSRWTLSSVGNALPVVGLKLTGIWRNNASALNWTTVAEYDNDHFEIERKYSQDFSFNKISAVGSKYADGNSQFLTAYEHTDAAANASAQIILYRLKQVDKNGRYQYSNTIAIHPDKTKEFIVTAYPTLVVNNSLFIQTGNLNIQKMQAQVFDMSGRLLMNQQLSYHSQLLQLPVMSKGMYRLVIRSGEWMYSSTFAKQ